MIATESATTSIAQPRTPGSDQASITPCENQPSASTPAQNAARALAKAAHSASNAGGRANTRSASPPWRSPANQPA